MMGAGEIAVGHVNQGMTRSDNRENHDAYCGSTDLCRRDLTLRDGSGVVANPARQVRRRTRCHSSPRSCSDTCAGQAALHQSRRAWDSRVVEIDTTGGPGFGFEHFKQLDFLRDKEVVL